MALAQGRYRWRHDQVLKEIAQCIEDKRKSNIGKQRSRRKGIEFIKEGEKRKRGGKNDIESYFGTAQDWKMEVDLGKRLKVPLCMGITNLRPDILLISEKEKQMGIIELTVPSEERIEISGELKKTKYETLVEMGRQKGWNIRMWAVEVGCRGFPAASMATLLKDLGYTGGQRKRLLSKIGSAAEIASHSIWKWSHIKEWGSKKT